MSRTLTYSEPEAYSEPRHIHSSGTFGTLLYSERWHIQNLRHIQKPVYIYDEALIIFTATIIFTNYNYFGKACYFEITILRQFLQRQLCSVKSYGARGSRGRWIFNILILILIYLAQLQLITVLVYRSRTPKSHEQGYLNFQQ